ncbi:MAG: diaminopimelate epimerase [Pseudomonadota bacterium]
MRVNFIKMHGLGNDFIVLDARHTALPEISQDIVRALADRREGIGCDQLIMLEPSEAYAFRMRIFNSDGGEVEACGNATRAVALLHGRAVQIETAGGVLALEPSDGGATVDMGSPRFHWEDIPLDYAMDTDPMPLAWEGLKNPIAVNVGNPHVVFFVTDVWENDLETLGPMIEEDLVFPKGVNVNVAQFIDASHLRLRVWERGAGLTRACGTGACATAVAAIRKGFVGNTVRVSLPGGDLIIEWSEGGTIRMTGPATESYRGSFNWDDFA